MLNISNNVGKFFYSNKRLDFPSDLIVREAQARESGWSLGIFPLTVELWEM